MNNPPPSAGVVPVDYFTNCPVCLEKILPPEHPQFAGRRIALVKPCGHKFHFECNAPWIEEKLTCPFDRVVIEEVVVMLNLPRDWQEMMVIAAKEGNIEIIQALLNRGADVDANKAEGDTPLAWAVETKHFDAALLLASRGTSDPISLFKLGNLFRDGDRNLPADLHQAESCYLKAAGLGSVKAMSCLGSIYLKGGNDFPVNLQQAKYWLNKAVRGGCPRAIASMGSLFVKKMASAFR
ncbi:MULTISPECIES: SEL1-like repeat protein [unclassified Endozoicomonas]|uniref:SEL1-like repeat protein n=1 Tax=unclassified Endozoicomonas TaxID=2644528 RepID=UPI003BB54DB3